MNNINEYYTENRLRNMEAILKAQHESEQRSQVMNITPENIKESLGIKQEAVRMGNMRAQDLYAECMEFSNLVRDIKRELKKIL
jgi:hypothetical protein